MAETRHPHTISMG